MATTTVTPAANSGEETPAGTGSENAKFVTPEDFEGYKTFLNKESQARRKELETLRAEVKSWQEAQAEKSAPAAHGKGDKAESLESAETARTVKELKEKFENAEAKASKAIIKAALERAVSGTKKDRRDVLLGYLETKVRIETVDGESVVVMDGEEGPERLTEELIRKRHGASWFPSSGRSGSGLNEGSGGAGISGVDFDRGMAEQAYFEKNKDAMLAEIARRKKAGH